MALALDHRWRDGLLAVALAAGAAAQLATSSSRGSWAAYVWVALTTLPLGLRHKAPVAVGLGIQLAFALGTPYFRVPDLLAQGVSAFLVATYVAALGPRSWAGACACGVGGGGRGGWPGLRAPLYGAPGAVLANGIYVAMTWAVAAAVRIQVERSQQSVTMAETAVRSSEENARQAVRDERIRLARELHDVLGHSISVMVLRARGGVHEHDLDPTKGAEALRDIEAVGSRALVDVRILLELDNETDDGAAGSDRSLDEPPRRHPLPGVSDITDLVESTRSAGIEIDFRVCGEPRHCSDILGLTAYRMIQESLTNVIRHSLSPVALVALRWSDSNLHIEVTDDGPANPAPGSRRGLIGMNDRVALAGGSLQYGHRPGGGFTVSAQIPLAPV